MKIDIKLLRWLLLGLYLFIIVGLFALGFAPTITLPDWLLFFDFIEGELFWALFVLAITIVSQLLFIFVPGVPNLCRPLRRRRLLAPVIMTALMMTILVIALLGSVLELLEAERLWSGCLFWILVALNWMGWGMVFFRKYKNVEGYQVLEKLTSIVFRGSLLQLLVTIPSHLIVSRRPGCFVGMFTAVGICSGILVMLWSFGSGIVLLFLKDKVKKGELDA